MTSPSHGGDHAFESRRAHINGHKLSLILDSIKYIYLVAIMVFEGRVMRIELTSLHGLNVYTDRGTHVGMVDDVIIDANEKKISGLAIGDVNVNMFDIREKGVIIPYRWVTAIGDVVLIKEVNIARSTQEKSSDEES